MSKQLAWLLINWLFAVGIASVFMAYLAILFEGKDGWIKAFLAIGVGLIVSGAIIAMVGMSSL